MDKDFPKVLIVILITVGLLIAYSYFNKPTLEERWLEVTKSAERLDKMIDKMVEHNLEQTQQSERLQTLQAD